MRTHKNSSSNPDGQPKSSRASSLDLNDDERRALAGDFVKLVDDYFAGVSNFPIFPQTTGDEIAKQLYAPAPTEALSLSELLLDCQNVIDSCRHNGHPRFFGYVASPSTPPGAFADLLASTVNPSVTSWRSAPAATQVERTVVRWLGSLIGYDENAQGLLTSGGSMANLTALLMAHRVKAGSAISQTGILSSGARMMIYASDQVHFSILKAADVLGLCKESVRLVPADDSFCIDTNA